MLSAEKFRNLCQGRKMTAGVIADGLTRGDLSRNDAMKAVRNWQKGLFKPMPQAEDIKRLAALFSVEEKDLKCWQSCYKYAPMSARKARLVSQLIAGRDVQDAMDLLKFTNKRAAVMINKVLKCAVADADEQDADVENLYISEAKVNDAGIRIGTKRWIAKDRGRAHPIHKKACHLYVTVTEA